MSKAHHGFPDRQCLLVIGHAVAYERIAPSLDAGNIGHLVRKHLDVTHDCRERIARGVGRRVLVAASFARIRDSTRGERRARSERCDECGCYDSADRSVCEHVDSPVARA